jgi:hypothetical protein
MALFFLAIIPMNEYSTIEHVLQIHDNHSEQFSINSDDGNDMPTYRHVEHIKTSASMIPFSLMNATDVSCSPKFSLRKLNILNIKIILLEKFNSYRDIDFLIYHNFVF